MNSFSKYLPPLVKYITYFITCQCATFCTLFIAKWLLNKQLIACTVAIYFRILDDSRQHVEDYAEEGDEEFGEHQHGDVEVRLAVREAADGEHRDEGAAVRDRVDADRRDSDDTVQDLERDARGGRHLCPLVAERR